MTYPELASVRSREIVFFQPRRICFINSFTNFSHSVSDSEGKNSDSGEESHTKYLPDHKNSSCLSLRLISVSKEFGDQNTVYNKLVEILLMSGGQGFCLSPICMKNHSPISLFKDSPSKYLFLILVHTLGHLQTSSSVWI